MRKNDDDRKLSLWQIFKVKLKSDHRIGYLSVVFRLIRGILWFTCAHLGQVRKLTAKKVDSLLLPWSGPVLLLPLFFEFCHTTVIDTSSRTFINYLHSSSLMDLLHTFEALLFFILRVLRAILWSIIFLSWNLQILSIQLMPIFSFNGC